MLYLLSNDIYKLFRWKSVYVLLILTIGYDLFAFIVPNYLYLDLDLRIPAIAIMLVSLFPNLSYFFIAICSSFFISSEFSYGTMNNVISRGYSRISIYLSKYICVVMVSFFMAVANALINAGVYGILFGFGTVSSGILRRILLAICLSFLIICAMCAMSVFFSFTFHNVGLALASNILLNAIVTMLVVYYELDRYLHPDSYKNTVDLCQYWIMYFFIPVRLSAPILPGYIDVRSMVITTLVYIAVFLILGIFIFSARKMKTKRRQISKVNVESALASR